MRAECKPFLLFKEKVLTVGQLLMQPLLCLLPPARISVEEFRHLEANVKVHLWFCNYSAADFTTRFAFGSDSWSVREPPGESSAPRFLLGEQ